MITRHQLIYLDSPDFSSLYEEAYISSHVEQIICLVLEKAFIDKDTILKFDVSSISQTHHKTLLDKLRTRLKVSSMYITHKFLYIDWS
jgi:hypothetical protein